jgi:hypothetical protein
MRSILFVSTFPDIAQRTQERLLSLARRDHPRSLGQHSLEREQVPWRSVTRRVGIDCVRLQHCRDLGSRNGLADASIRGVRV